MSYEGYSQFWCKNGHYWTIDCNLLIYNEGKQKCPICNEEEVRENMVDETNGSFDDDGTRIDSFIEPELVKGEKLICGNCLKEHICSCSVYKIPPKKKVDEDE